MDLAQTRSPAASTARRVPLGPALLALVAAATVIGLDPELIRFAEVPVTELGRIVAPLILLALFMERAVEVVVAAWREGGRQTLELASEAPDIADEERIARSWRLLAYRDETRVLALFTSLTLGVLIGVLGVRVLEQLVDADMVAALPTWQAAAFAVLDALVTGALLAGGADGLHKVVSAFTTFMEQSSRRLRSAP